MDGTYARKVGVRVCVRVCGWKERVRCTNTHTHTKKSNKSEAEVANVRVGGTAKLEKEMGDERMTGVREAVGGVKTASKREKRHRSKGRWEEFKEIMENEMGF